MNADSITPSDPMTIMEMRLDRSSFLRLCFFQKRMSFVAVTAPDVFTTMHLWVGLFANEALIAYNFLKLLKNSF